MARPTEYTPEIVEMAKEYLETFSDLGDVVPTIAGMACEIGRARSTLYKWAGEDGKEEFSDIFNQVAEYQERRLVNGGLSGGFNPAVTKMMLTKHGYSDKSEIDHRSGDGSMTPKGKSLDDFYADSND
jgi:hypothetical protein